MATKAEGKLTTGQPLRGRRGVLRSVGLCDVCGYGHMFLRFYACSCREGQHAICLRCPKCCVTWVRVPESPVSV